MKLKTRTVLLIDETEFSELVSETYGVPYRYQQQGEMMGEYEIMNFTVPDSLDNWDMDSVAEDIRNWVEAEPPAVRTVKTPGGLVFPQSDYSIELWWERENYPDFDSLIADMRQRGLIDPGNYALYVG